MLREHPAIFALLISAFLFGPIVCHMLGWRFIGRWKWLLLGWCEKHPRYWHLAYPRTFNFVAWVVPPADMGLRCWFRWAFKKASTGN